MQKFRELRGEFVRYASLSALGTLGTSCYILADTFFVAKGLGTAGLAALNLAIPVYNLIYGVGLMLGMGGATKFAVSASQGEREAGNRAYAMALLLAGIAAVAFVAAGLLFPAEIARLLGADEEVFDMTRTYLQVLLLFAPAFLLNAVLVSFVRNDGNPRLAMLATVGASLSNVVLDYLFIFPCGMGIFGAVFATGLAPVIGVCILLPHLLRRERGFRLTRRGLHPRLAGQEAALGFPSLVTQLSSAVVMITFNFLILDLAGNVGVAAYGVVANLALIAVGLYTGVAQGAQPLLSRAWGQRDGEGLQRLTRWSTWSVLALSLVTLAVILAFPGPIAALFNGEGDAVLQGIAEQGLRLYFLSSPFAAYNLLLATLFPSVERALPAHALSLLRGLVLLVPAAFAFAALWGLVGVWLAVPVTEAVTAAAGYLVLRRERARGFGGELQP